jgi:BirA family biotin operon repressor/biotin-[acetyl-CoA-carboxylase] ligase
MTGTPPLTWGAEALWQRLEPLLPGLSVEVLARADSTNTRLLERARAGQREGRAGEAAAPQGRRDADTQPCLLVAEQQTAGRGRLGRGWVSARGASLTFSLALPLSPVDWSGLSLAVGVALAEALDPRPAAAGALDPRRPPAGALDVPHAGAPRIHLKWPNDLWLLDAPGRGRKLGGVLIETVGLPGERRMCVVGVGLNVRPPPPEPGLPRATACLAELDAALSAPEALSRVAEPLVRGLLSFEREGFAPLVAAYAQRDLLLGQPVTTTSTEVPAGMAEGVDADGALLVRDGGLHRIVSGEVSVRLGVA